MADLTLRAPIESEKQGAYLHDRSRLPEAPALRAPELIMRWGIILMGVAFAAGGAALAFQTYDSWHHTRDVLLVLSVSLAGPAGTALGYIIYRRRMDAFFPAFLMIILACGLTAMNGARAYTTDGPDTFRDVLTIGTAVTLGVLFLYLIAAWIWLEKEDPTRAPQPEM